MDENTSPDQPESPQDEAARAYLQEQKVKSRMSAYWASIFGCCGCILLLPIPLALLGLIFL